MNPSPTPPALAALAAFPQLQAPCAPALAAQAHRIAERTAHFVARANIVRALDERIRASSGGVIQVAGPAGSGATALLCWLAATRPYPFWLPEDDAGAGIEALCAQLLALHSLPLVLVPPAAGRDAHALERLLAEAGAQRPPDDPLVVLIGRMPDEQLAPLAPPFPASVPPGVVIVLASAPKAELPLAPAARIDLPAASATLLRRLGRVAAQLGCPPDLAGTIAERAQGSFLYVRLAALLVQSGAFQSSALPAGLGALHEEWWSQLDTPGRRLAALVAAAGEPIEPALLAELTGSADRTIRRWIQRWQAFLEVAEGRVRIYHGLTRAFVVAQSGDRLAAAHAAYVGLAQRRTDGALAQLRPERDAYLVRQLARHAALSDAATELAVSPALASRAWAIARERDTGSMRAAAQDLQWLLCAEAAQANLLELVRQATLAGTLALLGRTLPADAAAEALEAALQRGSPRDSTLRRVREMLGQLPDGRDKALALRRLGEVCYALRMRASAMRMLSEALDLEAPGLPRAWRDEREETLVAFARAAIAIDMPQMALGITARIGHAERRGMIETEAVRWLLARDQRTRAEEVAYAIGHTTMHEWAMAEVAVGHARAGDTARGETVLSTLRTETAIACARGELACDAARHGDPHALGRLAPISNPNLCDRALALVAQALVAGNLPEDGLEAARTIEDRAIRTRTLIDLALAHPPNAADALRDAAADLAELAGDERAPLVAELAAAQASAGRLETALQTAALLPEEEERDRAQSRVAVALARRGNAADARIVADAIGDDDERDWAFDELAHMAAGRADWDEAFALARLIVGAEQRARTATDLAIAWARSGAAQAAHARIPEIEAGAERLRAYTAIAGPLVAQGGLASARAELAALDDPEQRSRYGSALAAAVAAHGNPAEALAIGRTIARPLDRARALVAIARAAMPDQTLAQQTLAAALRIAAALGRSEIFKCLEWSADTLARLGGADLLLAAASALDEIDSWWN
jgi:hypothetical protein